MSEQNSFLQNSGAMGQLILDYDWAKSKLGSITGWPQSLRNTLNTLLHSAFPMFLFWGDDLVCFYNDAFRPSLGAEGKHPAIGKNGSEVWPEIWEFTSPLINKVLTTGKPCWFEDQLVPFYRDGQIQDVYWTFSYSPAFNDANQISGVLVTCIETTEKVLAQKHIAEKVIERTKELEEAKESLLNANIYLQQILNSFKEPLQVLEPITENGEIIDFRFKLTNIAYSSYANTTPENLQGRKVSDVFPGYLETSSFFNPVKTFKTGMPETWEIHYDRDGLNLHNKMSTTKLGNEVLIHFTDFTELKNLQLELIKKIEELERSNKSLESFANAASHDLKEPVRKIAIYTTKLKDQLTGHLKENDLNVFSKIENATERMRLLINDIMQFAQLNHQPPQKEVVNLNESIQEVLEDLELDVEQKQATVQINQLPIVKGYHRQLQQLFQNLISNSLKYCNPTTPPKINITCKTEEEKGVRYNVIQVRDNGIGFEQKFEEEIFKVFARLHTKNKYQGNGIGLAIVKKIVDNHRGKITVESKPDNGAIFKVFLPIEQ